MRMSPSEAVMWAVEKDPSLRSDFTNITILDSVPSEQRLRATIERALVAIPRLGERVISAPLRIAPPEWRPDPTFHLEYHVRRVAIPEPGSMRDLLDVAGSITSPPLDRSRPLWEFTLVEGLHAGRAALLQRLHHTITDGVGGMRLSLSLVNLEREPAPDIHERVRDLADRVERDRMHETREDPVDRDSPFDVVRDALIFSARNTVELARRAASASATTAVHPLALPGRVRRSVELVRSLRRQVLITDRGHSAMFANRSLARRYDTLALDFDPLHRAGKALGASMNDVFVTGVARALGQFHREYGESIDALRMAMSVSTRDRGDVAANRFAPSRILVPATIAAIDDHLESVHDALTNIRSEPALDAVDLLAALTAGVPTAVLVTLLRAQTRTIDFATSNLRGSPVDLFLGGARIEASYPMGPRAGVPVNVTMMSYCGELHLGIHSDPAALVDPDLFLDCLRQAFAELVSLGV